jgi:hypothetical protein
MKKLLRILGYMRETINLPLVVVMDGSKETNPNRIVIQRIKEGLSSLLQVQLRRDWSE